MLSRRGYELLALGLAAVFFPLHWLSAIPLVGLATSHQGGALHRLVQAMEGRVTDTFFRLRGPRPPHEGVVVVELDERGAQRWGLWPWPRDVLATTLDRLLDADAKVVGLDVAFTDPSTNGEVDPTVLTALEAAGDELPGPLVTLRRELATRATQSPDARLEASLRRAGPRVVQGLVPLMPEDEHQVTPEVLARSAGTLASHVITRVPRKTKGAWDELNLDGLVAYEMLGALAPLPRFADAGTRFGHFATVTDVDGTIRRAAAVARLRSPPGLLPSLGLAVAAAALDATVAPRVEGGELTRVDLVRGDGQVIEVPCEDMSPLVALDYPGPLRGFSRLSAVDVYDGAFPKAAVAGKAVLVGLTITGSSGDQRVTPFEEFAPGIVTHAALVSDVLSGGFLARPPLSRARELALMLLLGLGLSVAIPRVGFRWKLALVAGVLALWWGVSFAAFTTGLRVAVVVPTAQLLTTSFALIFLGYLSVDREKLKLRSAFSRYLGEDVVELAIADPEKLNRGEKREMTVLFSDIRGFTSLAERMSPEALAAFINAYLTPMTRLVFDEAGTLDKYIGDALMAFWNAPLDQPDHALRACRAAVRMVQKLDELKASWKGAGLPELEIGVGVSSGPMVVGNMGSDVRVDYTVLGDAVNLGSRLEGLNKEYGTRIVIGEGTWRAVRGQVVARRLGAVRVKGRREPVAIFELRALGVAPEAEGEVIARFEGALDAWRERRFDEARAGFEAVLARWPGDAPSRRYLEALPDASATPASEWDGVITMVTK